MFIEAYKGIGWCFHEGSLSSFILFQSLHHSQLPPPPLVPCSPHLVALAPHPCCKTLAVAALAASSLCQGSFAWPVCCPVCWELPWMQGFTHCLLPRHQRGVCAVCCEQLEDQTRSLEPRAVTRALICSLLRTCCSGFKRCSSFRY